jgi:ornithine cyclodeaminase/alanine dehydrogenase-like protein (mu-crystallin family)
MMKATDTLRVIDAATLRACVGFEDLLLPVARAFSEFSKGRGVSPASVFNPGLNGEAHVKSAYLQGHSIFTVKVGTWFIENMKRGELPGGGFIAVFDSVSGKAMAILADEHHLSDIRTAAAGGLACQYLAPEEALSLGLLGTGVQAYLQALAAALTIPSLKHIYLWGRNQQRVHILARTLQRRLPDKKIEIKGHPKEVLEDSNIVIVATASTEPLVKGEWLRPGHLIVSLGSDDPSKRELDAQCFSKANIIIADSRKAVFEHAGDVREAVDKGILKPSGIYAELGEVISGDKQDINNHRREILTIVKLVGLGIQDLAAAETALKILAKDGKPPLNAPACAIDLV